MSERADELFETESHPRMLGSFLLFALLISAFPTLDIEISRRFFDGSAFPGSGGTRC